MLVLQALIESLDRFTKTLAELKELARAENDERYRQNNHQFRESDSYACCLLAQCDGPSGIDKRTIRFILQPHADGNKKMSYLCAGSTFSGFYHENRTACVTDHLFSDAAHEKPPQAGPAMGPDDDHVCFLFPRQVE